MVTKFISPQDPTKPLEFDFSPPVLFAASISVHVQEIFTVKSDVGECGCECSDIYPYSCTPDNFRFNPEISAEDASEFFLQVGFPPNSVREIQRWKEGGFR